MITVRSFVFCRHFKPSLVGNVDMFVLEKLSAPTIPCDLASMPMVAILDATGELDIGRGHYLALELQAPDGGRLWMIGPRKIRFEADPNGIAVSRQVFRPNHLNLWQSGTYWFRLWLDESPVARCPFFLTDEIIEPDDSIPQAPPTAMGLNTS